MAYCTLIFWKFYAIPCLPGFLQKWQPELWPNSAQKLKKKTGLIADASKKNSRKTKYIRKKIKNKIVLYDVKSYSTDIGYFDIKSKLSVFGLTCQSFIRICAAVIEKQQ